MENVQSKVKIHPLIIAAAGSVILFSVLGSAAIMGWIPKGGAQPGVGTSEFSGASKNTTAVAAASAPEAQTVNATPAPSPAARVVARPAPRPVARTEPRPAHDTHPAPAESLPAPDARHAENQHTVVAQAQEAAPTPTHVVAPICHECGVIQSVNEIENPGEGSGLGAVAGGVVGAIAGKQIGGGRGRTAMSVLGAVGGAFAGNAIEKDVRKVKSYDITIRFEDGSTRSLSQATQPIWRSGDRVRLINGAIQPNA